MLTIDLIHPSRGRAVQAYNTVKEWLELSSGHYEIKHIISVDNDDPQLSDYLDYFPNSIKVISDNNCMVSAMNMGALESKADILIGISDDFKAFKNWDLDIIQVFTGRNGGYLLKTNDGTEGYIVTLPIMNREYYLSKGFIYDPDFSHLFADTCATHIAELEGKLIVRNNLRFIHRHPMNDKSVKSDAGYKKTSGQESWNINKAVYLKKVRENLGFPPEVDIFKLSEAGQPHVNWLKKELGL